MEINKINRMWRIDSDAQLGNDIKEEDKKFFNENFDDMTLTSLHKKKKNF